MNLVRYKFLMHSSNIEAMWNWAKTNEVNFHCIKRIIGTDSVAYEALMAPDTILMFKLCVPSRDYS